MKNYILFSIAVLFLIGCVSTEPSNFTNNTSGSHNNISNNSNYQENISQNISINNTIKFVTWDFFDEWKPKTTPPECTDEIVEKSPVDFSIATSILYPGQIRGGDFKPHGGVRFDNSGSNSINVYVPMDGYVMRGVRYYESGELQYLFDIVNPCGIMHRFDHIKTPSEKFFEIAENFDEPKEEYTITTDITNLQIKVNAGDLIATEIGMSGSVSFDWGVYDLRNKNIASNDAEWFSEHSGQMAPYGLCWLELLPTEDSVIVNALPGGDYVSSTESDYC